MTIRYKIVCTILHSTDLFLSYFERLPVIVTTSRCQHQAMSAKHKPSTANAAPSQSSSKSLSPGAPPRGRDGGAEVTMGGGKLSSSVAVYEGSSKRQKPASLHSLRQRRMQFYNKGKHRCVCSIIKLQLRCFIIYFNYNFAE